MSWYPRDTQWLKHRSDMDRVTVADTNTESWTDLNGTGLRALACRFWITNPLAVAVDYFVRPNGSAGNAPSHSLRFAGAGGQDNASDLIIGFNNSLDFISGVFFLVTELKRFNKAAAPAVFRRFEQGCGGAANSPPAFGAIRQRRGWGFWLDVASLIQSISIVTIQNGTSTLVNGIGLGSAFEWWELR